MLFDSVCSAGANCGLGTRPTCDGDLVPQRFQRMDGQERKSAEWTSDGDLQECRDEGEGTNTAGKHMSGKMADGATCPPCCCEQHCRQLKDLLDEWGQRHARLLQETLRDAMAAQMPLPTTPLAPMATLSSGYITSPSQTPQSLNREGSSLANGPLQRDQTLNLNQPLHLTSQVKNNVIGDVKLDRSSKRPSFNDRRSSSSSQRRGFFHIAENIIESRFFEVASMVAIIANAMFMGIEIHFSMSYLLSNGIEANRPHTPYIELMFSVWFGIEVILRLVVLGWKTFFSGQERWWNIFDFSLAVHALVEICIDFSGNGNLSHLRILRLVRMVKLLRVLRLVRGISELRFILNSILGSVKSTLWASILLLVTCYIFSTIFFQAAAQYVNEQEPSENDEAMLRMYWGSIPNCMLSLLASSTGGYDWGMFAETFWRIGGIYCLLFLFYLILFLFVVMPTITGLFVEATINQSHHDRTLRIQSELDKKEQYIDNLRRIFYDFDSNRDGVVTLHEFVEALGNQEMQAFLNSLNIDASDAEVFFRMLTEHTADKMVDLETFVVGCIKLRGEAKAMDIFLIISQQMHLLRQMENVHQVVIGPMNGAVYARGSSQQSLQSQSSAEMLGEPLTSQPLTL